MESGLRGWLYDPIVGKVVTAAAAALAIFSDRLGITVALGVAGAGIAFALQETGGKVALASATLHLVEAPLIEVRIKP